MATYKTPGVYVEEISTLPPSVAEVATAVPAFLGYTAAGKKVARISTMLDYTNEFGGPHSASFTATTDADGALTGLSKADADYEFLMYYALSLFFKNGGGSCYIVSVGDYSAAPNKADFEAGLRELEKEDEPTLILLTDAVNLAPADYYDVAQQSLAQCAKLGDRFAILDVLNKDNGVEEFRNMIGTANLLYGAAYYPYLHTTLNYAYGDEDVAIESAAAGNDSNLNWSGDFDENDNGAGITVSYTGPAGDTPEVRIYVGSAGDDATFEVNGRQLKIQNATGKTGAAIAAFFTTWAGANDSQGFNITQTGDGSGSVDNTSSFVDLTVQEANANSNSLGSISESNTGLYNAIRTAMGKQRVVMPPSAGVAGVYARVDGSRGVWKAPANESLSAVIGPVVKITHDDQENLNVDATAGKSINAIRAFSGKGTLIWGARTLAGNDNEWRYVSVRRLFNMIEESTQKATGFAVFEPNDANTWLKVKAMIESYLYGLWEQGALAGPTPEAAYFVNVGLGKTMTTQDILEGRMIVEIGVAAVRPAEFIILRFSHKLQEA